jgi:hypothetical protein
MVNNQILYMMAKSQLEHLVGLALAGLMAGNRSWTEMEYLAGNQYREVFWKIDKYIQC